MGGMSSAPDVRITEVAPIHLRVPLAAGEDAPRQDVFLLRVAAAAPGATPLVAFGEALIEDAEALADGVETLSPCVLGRSPLDRGVLWERMREMLDDPDLPEGCFDGVVSALDVALWDLAAQAVGLPVAGLLGGAYYRTLDCYCVARAADTAEKTLQRARDLISAGYGAVSIELSGDVAVDCDLVTATRKTLGGNVRLIFDARGRYTELEAALEVGAAVDRAEGFWFARPLPEGDWGNCARLRKPLATPLAAGTDVRSAAEALEALRAGALDVLLLDLRLCGGITGARQIAEVARVHEARVSFAPQFSGLTALAAAHCSVATPACVLFPATAGIPTAFKEMLATPLSYSGGFLRPPDAPGLGISLAEQFVSTYGVD